MNRLLSLIFILIAGNVLVWSGFFYKPAPQVNFLTVGQGDAILIQDADTQVLIDGGPDQKVLNQVESLIPKTDRKIEAVIMTHPDLDHFKGLLSVVERYEVESFISTGEESNLPEFFELEKELENKKVPRYRARGGQYININDLELKVLYPFSVKEGEKHNANSLVMKIAVEGYDFLLAGDIERKNELLVAEVFKEELASEVLKVAHHGSAGSSTSKFISMVKPEFSVISVGRNNYGHPSIKVLERLKNSAVLRTDRDGTVSFIVKNGRLEIRKD